jgi:hypothetical protein
MNLFYLSYIVLFFGGLLYVYYIYITCNIYIYIYYMYIYNWLVVSIPLNNISQLGLLCPIWKKTCSTPPTSIYICIDISG